MQFRNNRQLVISAGSIQGALLLSLPTKISHYQDSLLNRIKTVGYLDFSSILILQ